MNKALKKNLIFIFITILLNIIIYKLKIPLLNRLSFAFTGIIFNLLFYKLIFYTLNRCNIKLKKFDKILLIIFIALSFIIYTTLIFARKSVYTWDNVVYYGNLNNKLLPAFNINNLFGYYIFINTVISGDYGNFLLAFVYPFYSVLSKNVQWFQISYFFAGVVPAIILLYSLGLYVVERCNYKNRYNKLLKISILSLISFFPMLHSASILGRPDIIGINFIVLLILLTVNYKFNNKDIKHWIILFFTTVSLVLTRRWYIYFVLSYYIGYIIVLFISTLIENDVYVLFKRIKNVTIFGVFSLMVVFWFGREKIYSMMNTNYSKLYSGFHYGGIKYELMNQVNYLGIIFLIIIIVGIIYSLLKNKNRKMTVVLFITYILSVLLFIKVQNFEIHHSLILVPFYIYGIYNFVGIKYKNIIYSYCSCILVLLVVLLSILNSCLFNNKVLNKYFGNINLYPEIRNDLNEINEVINYVSIDKNKKTIVLEGGGKYDCSTFINYPKPYSNTNIYSTNYLYNQGFPVEYFKSTYYVLMSPIYEWKGVKEAKILDYILDIFLNNKYVSSKFEIVKTITINDTKKAIIYKRIKEVNNKEINIFIEKFKGKYDDYKELFDDKLIEYKENFKNN